MKKQNKEQVPPPAVEPKKPSNKKQTKKAATLTSQNQKQGRFRSLEEALRAVSAPRLRVGEEGGPACGGHEKGEGDGQPRADGTLLAERRRMETPSVKVGVVGTLVPPPKMSHNSQNLPVCWVASQRGSRL